MKCSGCEPSHVGCLMVNGRICNFRCQTCFITNVLKWGEHCVLCSGRGIPCTQCASVTTDQGGFIVAMENVDEVCDGQHTCVPWKKKIGINIEKYSDQISVTLLDLHKGAEFAQNEGRVHFLDTFLTHKSLQFAVPQRCCS